MTMKRSMLGAVLGLCVGLAVSLDAAAQAKPEVLVKQRQAAMTLIGKYFGPLGAMAQGKAPYNADIAKRNAEYLVALAKMPWDGFDASTADVKSRTKAEAYTEMGKFKQGAENMQAAITKLASAAGDESAFKAAVGAVGKTCAACHDAYREKQ